MAVSSRPWRISGAGAERVGGRGDQFDDMAIVLVP
jgi:hypothetical protein